MHLSPSLRLSAFVQSYLLAVEKKVVLGVGDILICIHSKLRARGFLGWPSTGSLSFLGCHCCDM